MLAPLFRRPPGLRPDARSGAGSGPWARENMGTPFWTWNSFNWKKTKNIWLWTKKSIWLWTIKQFFQNWVSIFIQLLLSGPERMNSLPVLDPLPQFSPSPIILALQSASQIHTQAAAPFIPSTPAAEFRLRALATAPTGGPAGHGSEEMPTSTEAVEGVPWMTCDGRGPELVKKRCSK